MASVDLNEEVKIICALKRIGVSSKGEAGGGDVVMMVCGVSPEVDQSSVEIVYGLTWSWDGGRCS